MASGSERSSNPDRDVAETHPAMLPFFNMQPRVWYVFDHARPFAAEN
jgi:hypothetical protein